MTPTEAAQIIGCCPAHVRFLIRQGKLKATKRVVISAVKKTRSTEYTITKAEAERIRKQKSKRGWKRGRKRRRDHE